MRIGSTLKILSWCCMRLETPKKETHVLGGAAKVYRAHEMMKRKKRKEKQKYIYSHQIITNYQG